METLTLFTLDESSVINMAIYFNFVAPGAWVEMNALDRNTGNQATRRYLKSKIVVIIGGYYKEKLTKISPMQRYILVKH